MRGAILGGSLCDGGIYWINRPAAHFCCAGTPLRSATQPPCRSRLAGERVFTDTATLTAQTDSPASRLLRRTVTPEIYGRPYRHRAQPNTTKRFGNSLRASVTGSSPCRSRLAGEHVCTDTATLAAQTGSPASRLLRRTVTPEIYGRPYRHRSQLNTTRRFGNSLRASVTGTPPVGAGLLANASVQTQRH